MKNDMVTLWAGAAQAPSLLNMVVDDDRGLVRQDARRRIAGQDYVGRSPRHRPPHPQTL
jgi:hypothetical protein